MIVIEIIQYALAAILGFLVGYQLLLSICALKARKISSFETSKQRKFAVVIPAHNEEKYIKKTLYSMYGFVYPKSRYDLIVVADNCSDNTASMARGLGATVLERKSEKKGKGYALRWAFDKILQWEDSYDSIIVFDSDSLVSGNYLEVMNYYLDHGSEVIQSTDLVLAQPGVWSSESTRIGFLLYNYVKPLGQKVLGFDMGLRGNGMCFSTEILKNIPWQAWSLTEDVEYGLKLQLKGIDIDFAPEASVWAQMPKHAKNAESQRKRWEIGRYPIIKKFTKPLLSALIRKKSLKYLDSIIGLLTPPLVNLLFGVLFMGLVSLILWALALLPIHFIVIWAVIAGMGVFHLLIGLYAAGADRQLYKSLLYIPLYAAWKIKLYANALTDDKEQRWIRTTRET